jgi:adenosylcobinamide kinase / adenosylcobinamide-phosphate guanylyltransferase
MSTCHFVIGGVRSGKSAHAQALVLAAERAGCAVSVIATALPADEQMRERIDRHRADRPAHWPVVEVLPTVSGLADAIAACADPQACELIDCLTLWLSQLICPPAGVPPADASAACAQLLRALDAAPGRFVIVSNEIGLGVMPVDAATRAVVDALGRLHQAVAARSCQVSWMVAGLPVPIKGGT